MQHNIAYVKNLSCNLDMHLENWTHVESPLKHHHVALSLIIYKDKYEAFFTLINAFFVVSLVAKVFSLLIFDNSHSGLNIIQSSSIYLLFFSNKRVY